MSFAGEGLTESFHSLIESDVRSLLNRISNFLAGRGVESYIVGGFVRDVLLGRNTADIDITVAQDALEKVTSVGKVSFLQSCVRDESIGR